MKTLAFTLTPALAVVLYVMAGVNTTTVYPGRDHAREVAALYTVRQSMVQWMERYVCNRNQGLPKLDCQEELDKSLERESIWFDSRDRFHPSLTMSLFHW